MISQPKILLSILPMFWPKYPPLGLGYLQAYLLEQGLQADILDLNNCFYQLADSELKKDWLVSANTFLEKKIIPTLREHYAEEFDTHINKMLEYDIIGFSCFKSNFENTMNIIRILKARKPHIKIVVGGPELARQYFKTNGDFTPELKSLVDHIVVGEGEDSFYQYIVRDKQSNSSLTPSIFSQTKDLLSLPHPKFVGLDFKNYRVNAVPIEFSRGCVRKCNFCSERLLFQGYRTRSIEGIISEIEFYKRERNIEYFIFFDSMLNGNLKQFEKLIDAILERFGSIRWEAQMAVREDMNEQFMEKIKKSGCYNIFIGLESGCDRTLQKMNKGFTSGQAERFFQKLHAAHLHFGVSMMVGYPGETEEDFEESLRFILKNRHLIPKIEQVNPFTYYEGTKAEREGDYRLNLSSLNRMHRFVEEITQHNMRYTKAFIGNLIEKSYYANANAN